MKQATLPQKRPLVRAMTHDHAITYDQANAMRVYDGQMNHMGVPFGFSVQAAPYRTNDGQLKNHRVYDSTGAFLVGELERLDQKLHEPLADVTWGRDIDLREDVSIADEVSSFTLSSYASAGGLGSGQGIGNGKAWMGKSTDQVTGIGLDIGKIPHPLTPWGMELKYTILELESAAKLGRPVDQQKFAGLQLKYQMDVDEQVYIGDTSLGLTGLVNSDLVTNVNNVVAGAAGGTTWATKTPDEILTDINTALTSVWTASAFAVMPGRILLPPTQYGSLATAKVSLAGNMSVLKYVQENNILTTSTGRKLEILPSKWCVGAGVSGTIGTLGTVDRMVVYTKDKDRVRFPLTPLQRTPIQYDSIYHKTTYFGRLGAVEVVYPETIGYFDGI
jgi:hypothetical protein